MTNSTTMNAIGLATTEVQAVLELIAHRLHANEEIPAEDVFTLYAAVRVALVRLDSIHYILEMEQPVPSNAVARAPGVMQ